MYSTSLGRHSASVVQKPSGVAARLLSSTPGRVRISRAGTFAGVEIPAAPNSKDVKSEASANKPARRPNNYKAGQSPATFQPERTRTFQPGLSWLGDDEFESTGLAYKLARHHMQREAASKPAGGSGPDRNTNRNANAGSGPRTNGENARTRTKASNNFETEASQRRRDPSHTHLSKQRDPPKVETSQTARRPATSYPTLKLKPSPVPQTPAHVNFESTDFTSLFGASSLPTTYTPTSQRIAPSDAVSRRVQLALEYRGGDYSNLAPKTLVTSQGDPLVYAANTLARRRDLGPNMRSSALEIVREMVKITGTSASRQRAGSLL
ncbi:hypothetical protein BJ322DRAFT_1093757 [Thelephora terrestris]|uniref:Uncharacterized protein n=1 Tax=Thelephora terrestris TaxID=56493 RepID=A0A9P6H3P2_9AGAM|nr:hypothetical protein BJ322DRAFT_1093757 [Thelephora terrestris]